MESYMAVGPPAYLVLEHINYTDTYDLEVLANISNSLSLLNETV